MGTEGRTRADSCVMAVVGGAASQTDSRAGVREGRMGQEEGGEGCYGLGLGSSFRLPRRLDLGP